MDPTPDSGTRRLTAVSVALLVLGCLGAAAAPASGQADGLERALRARLDAFTDSPSIPGATLGVALDDGTAFSLSAGVADTATGAPMPSDGLMLQGSVGKTYFSAVALQLVAEGRLSLDRPVAEHFPGAGWVDRLPGGREISLRHLLTHTSGLSRYELSPAFLQELARAPSRTFTPDERLAYVADTEPAFAPGEGWTYADTNYILVAMLIEAVTGGSAYGEVRHRLLEPLGLDRTVPSDRPGLPGLVQGYAGPDNPFGSFDATLSDGVLRFNPQFEWGGGGFASTAEDLARWIHELQQGAVIPRELREDYLDGVPAPLGPESWYGMGVIGMELPAGTARGHSGFMPGYRTEAYHFPELGVSLALQVNSSDLAAYSVQPLQLLSDLAAIVAAERSAPGA